jgi:hypothetical protein
MRPEHNPVGDPCVLCKHPRLAHRVPHAPKGDPCAACGLPAENHHARTEAQAAVMTAAQARGLARAEVERKAPGSRTARARSQRKKDLGPKVVIGIDGEGQGRAPHRYVYLAAADEHGTTWSVEDPAWRPAWTGTGYQETRLTGLRTVACLEFLFTLPEHAHLFAFAFGYDLTKMLEDVDNATLWLLHHPDERRRKGKAGAKLGPLPVTWKGYELNLQSTHFTVRRVSDGTFREVWDLFKFYGCRFTSALADWKVGSDAEHAHIQAMKEKRGEFDREAPGDVAAYCNLECVNLARLGRKLIAAHDAVDLSLKVFHGPGSTAGRMLGNMGILDAIRPVPKGMIAAVVRAFFGGRFENSVVGPVDEPLEGWDISSAYPYHMTFLPCLVHGRWRKTRRRADLDATDVACVHYGIGPVQRGSTSPLAAGAWAPFPHRMPKGSRGPATVAFPSGQPDEGSICFPRRGGGGWVYLQEYLAGERIFAEVEFREAWVYEKRCDCQPFHKIPYFYLYRLLLGKEGPGITVKLGINSGYGKLAQSVGSARFNCWLWAGMITSGCRAQILEMLGLHRDPTNLLMVATDGIVTRERLTPPAPRDTGTLQLLPGTDLEAAHPDGTNKKPLGGWERKPLPNGMFFARPGIYFPLHLGDLGSAATKEEIDKAIKEIKGRGVGKAVLVRHYHDILRAWVNHKGTETVTVTEVPRFCGAKTSLHRSGKPGAYRFHRADGKQKSETGAPPAYGQWVLRPVVMSFDPLPKRAEIRGDHTLALRDLDPGQESAPYDRAVKSKERRELEAFRDEVVEQPDLHFGELTELFTEEMAL